MYDAPKIFIHLHGASLSPYMMDISHTGFFFAYFQCLVVMHSPTLCPILSTQLPLVGFFV